jgi:hypothetical protein
MHCWLHGTSPTFAHVQVPLRHRADPEHVGLHTLSLPSVMVASPPPFGLLVPPAPACPLPLPAVPGLAAASMAAQRL